MFIYRVTPDAQGHRAKPGRRERVFSMVGRHEDRWINLPQVPRGIYGLKRVNTRPDEGRPP